MLFARLLERLTGRKRNGRTEAENDFPPLTVFDMHCHAGFVGGGSGATAVAAAAREAGVGLLSATVTPAEYEAQRAALDSFANVRVGLGLHPWWLDDGRCGEADVQQFCELAKDARFVAEIGLDFGGARAASRDVQRAAFERMAAVCAGGAGASARMRRAAGAPPAPPVLSAAPPASSAPSQTPSASLPAASAPLPVASQGPLMQPARKVLSLHAFDAASDVLDVLERTGCLDACDCVFHWFSGSHTELLRAVEAGCYFSVNRRMLATKRGFAYLRSIPADRLLVETDMPSQEVEEFSFEQQHALLLDAREQMQKVVRDPGLGALMAATSARLLGMGE